MHQHPGPKAKNAKSSASGAYQITFETYNELVKRGGPGDFSPASQDWLALQILRQKGALTLIWDGQLQGAFMMLNRTWDSLPGGAHQLITKKGGGGLFLGAGARDPQMRTVLVILSGLLWVGTVQSARADDIRTVSVRCGGTLFTAISHSRHDLSRHRRYGLDLPG